MSRAGVVVRPLQSSEAASGTHLSVRIIRQSLPNNQAPRHLNPCLVGSLIWTSGGSDVCPLLASTL